MIQVILNILYTKLSIKINNSIDIAVTDRLIANIFSKKYAVIEKVKEGEIVTRLNSISRIREKKLYWILNFPIQVFIMLITIYILFDQNSIMALLIFFPIILAAGIVIVSSESLRERSLVLFNENELFSVLLFRVISNLGTIKGFSATESFKNCVVNKYSELKKENEKFITYSTILSSIKGSIMSIFSLAVLAIGAYYIIDGQLASGTLLMFNSLSTQILNPFMAIANIQTLYEQGKIAELKCEDLIKTEYYTINGKREIEHIDSITVNNLQYEYQVGYPVLRNITVSFWKNKSYAIIGTSGAGKTTLAKLLVNYYEPSNGEICINDISSREYELMEIQRKIIYIQQDVEVFSDTILENILMGRNIPIDIVRNKAGEIGFDKIVESLPYEYDTIIGENGLKLSMGQMQLLNILRATLEEYEVIIFDEVTNGLDKNYRDKIKLYLQKYGNIKIFITHDLEFAKSCNAVFKIENGTINEVRGKEI